MCFSCDGGLKNWDSTDEPWTEHAKWFDQCPYLKLKKSPEFIRIAKLATGQPEEHQQEEQHQLEESPVIEEATNSHSTDETQEIGQTKPIKPLLDSDSGYSSVEDPEIPEARSGPSTKELLEENERLKDERSCRVCYIHESNILFLPCRHLVTCPDCAVSVEKCPVCRSEIECTVKVFKS